MNKILKTFLGILIILLPLALTLGLLFNNLAKNSFYPTSGQIKVSGLSSQVKVYFDDYGVPHIFAANENDMYFAMGYMHAQDRLWQMDLTRRVAEGRLSELFGSRTLDFDKLFRTIGIDKFAYKLHENVSPKTREILKAYSDGVNKFIEDHKNNLPVEFDALNYRPEPWKPQESLMIARLMGWDLNIAWYTDYIFGEVINKVGLEKASEIFPDTTMSIYKKPEPSSNQNDTTKSISLTPSPLQRRGALHNSQETAILGKEFFSSYEDYRSFMYISGSHTGSNSWVISGVKSESGKPILANDPHLGFQAPSKWYEVQLKCNDEDVTGMSIPGVPCIVIGNNRYISWGLTNLMNDETDFYVMQKDSSGENKYFYKNQSCVLDSANEKINVKDSTEADFTIHYTKIGPVISELNKLSLMSRESDAGEYKNKILTFKWTGYENSDEISTFYKFNHAKNWDDFISGLKDFGTPAQNFIYADIAGNIGYHAAGKVPIRKSADNNRYVYPSSEELEWTGFVDFDKLPNTFNPKEGYIITANTNPFEWLKTEPKNRYYISYLWEPSSRFDRIKEVFDTKSQFNIDDYKIIQLSYQSPYAKEISKYIVNAYQNFSSNNSDIIWTVEQFKKWNGELRPNEPIGSVYSTFYVYLLKNIYEDELGEKVFHDFLSVQNISYRSTMNLLKQNNSSWFNIADNQNKQSRDEVIRKSLEDAINFLRSKFSNPDINTWNWGELHQVKFRHPLGTVEALDKTFNIGPFPVGGDQTTVNNSEYNFNEVLKDGTFKNVLGPSMRMIVDMSDASHSHTVITTGESGQPIHPDYSDQSRMWLYGEYKDNTMNEEEMVSNQYNLLILTPNN